MKSLIPLSQVQERVRKRYVDRLAERLRKMRRHFVARNWGELKSDCKQLKVNVDSFGFGELKDLAEKAETAIDRFGRIRSAVPTEAKVALDNLLLAMDQIVAVYQVYDLGSDGTTSPKEPSTSA